MEPVPQVLNSTTPLPSSPAWKKRLPFAGIGVLIVVILMEILWGFNLLTSPASFSPATANPALVETVTPQLILLPSKKSYRLNEIVPVDIKVVTAGNPVDSIDVILRYDPAKLEASRSGFFTLGKIYPEYPVADFDNKSGIIQISATSPLEQPGFSGIGTLATLNFRSKTNGPAEISVEFQKNSTADSNLVLANSNQDILDQVRGTEIMISEAAAAEEASAGKTCNGFFQYCQLGEKTGKQFCQSGVLQNNQCTFDPKLTVSCTECQLQ